MPRDSLKWRVNEAVQNSALPPPARLIMLVLSDMADSNTGEIPAKQKVSVTELVRRTGLKETTVKTHRALLERLGWVVIIRPTAAEAARHVPSRYRIAVGTNPAGGRETTPGEVEGDSRETTPETSPRGSGDDPRNDDRGSGDDPAGGRETTTAGVGRRPPSYYYDRNDQYDQVLGADAPSGDPDGTLFGAPAKQSATATENKPRRQRKPEPQRDDVDALCARLHDLMIGNGCKPPKITEAWKTEARLLLDLDGRDFADALNVLEWSQYSPFWKPNIHSIPKFREKYDTLRQQRDAERERRTGNVVPLQRANGHVGFQDSQDKDYSLDGYLAQRNGA